MDTFTAAYAKLRDVVGQQAFAPEWQSLLLDEIGVRALLAAEGPASSSAGALDRLRARIDKDGLDKRGDTIFEAAKPGPALRAGAATGAAWWAAPVADLASKIASAAAIVGAGKGSAGALAERAAALKMLSHLYRTTRRGAQDLWVYAPPKSFARWVFDEISGSEEHVRSRLDQDDEIYAAGDRQAMCVALAHAMKWCLDAVGKLSSPTAATRALVKDWFADQSTTEAQVDSTVAALRDGFKTIAGVCNSNVLIFSDEPVDRNKVYNSGTGDTGWKDWAFVRPSEDLDVIYIQGAFVKSGATGRTWKCALTVIHEISHRALGTKDLMYDYSGLRPDKARFPSTRAIRNADSWAYFVTDLAGMLAPADRHTVLRVGAAKRLS